MSTHIDIENEIKRKTEWLDERKRLVGIINLLNKSIETQGIDEKVHLYGIDYELINLDECKYLKTYYEQLLETFDAIGYNEDVVEVHPIDLIEEDNSNVL